jgi:predicted membrane protein
MDLFARLKWGSIFMLAGYVLAKLMMRLNGIVPRGIAARVFNGIDTGLFYLMICISAFVAAGIVATILVNHFKEKKKAKEKLAEDERQKTREMKWKKEREEAKKIRGR